MEDYINKVDEFAKLFLDHLKNREKIAEDKLQNCKDEKEYYFRELMLYEIENIYNKFTKLKTGYLDCKF